MKMYVNFRYFEKSVKNHGISINFTVPKYTARCTNTTYIYLPSNGNRLYICTLASIYRDKCHCGRSVEKPNEVTGTLLSDRHRSFISISDETKTMNVITKN